ncbi:alpha/beta fold hydrolase [Falsiroseomonas stagni]|uniref:3-oxoadipate enol-lactonase n=1 Tax=Falsiroseomonas stagni DSM 19981 TaxID=1123062 RepID=A0A1I4AYJ6_9PROT|nr:alpha/beta hydrolase [Falsiroseomonas stagni]SFK60676.1 3-oxoadipate enol-lactonase [Falsiroseomonas stagni DSM 19981]
MSLLHHRLSGRAVRPAPTLLLIHPMGASLGFWDACLPAWDPHFAVLAIDLRSAGASPRGDTPPGLDQHVADIEALRASLGIERMVPVACAVGCMVAAAYAARHPDHVAALVLSNPTPRTAEAARAMLVARAAALRAHGMAAILPGAVERPFEAQPRDARYDSYLATFAAQDVAAYADAVEGFATADARADLPLVRCPTLLVPAAHDLLLPPALAEEVQALMQPGLARIALDEEGAHFLPYQRPAAFAARVLDFLAPLTQPGA